MMWKKKENKFLWSKESDKRNALYVNLCTVRQREQLNNVQIKSDRASREMSKKGDDEVEESRWSNALSFFSKALCFAESNEQMSYCFANRSKCFYEMKMYKESLVDIDLAKQYKYSKIDELEQQQENCVNLLDVGKQSESFVPKLSYPSHEKFPGLADVLRIERNQEFGLHIVATADIDVGKTVLMERAFTTLSIGNEQRCTKCFSTYTNLVPCKHCTRALFCLDSCEICDIHSLECGLQLPKTISLVREDFLPVVRSIVVALNIFGRNVNELKEFVENVIVDDQMKFPPDSIDGRSQYSIFLRHFDKNHPDGSNTTKSNIQSIYNALMGHRPIAEKFTTKHHQRFLMHLIGHHISIRRNIANGIEFRNKLVIPVIGGYFNHSCIPNAIMLPIDGYVVTTICRPIKSGEQICISYHGTKFQSPFLERQKIIEHEFYFKCKCERCVMEVTETLEPCTFLDDQQRVLLKNSAETLLYTIEKRKMVTELCVELLNKHGRVNWCEDLGKVLSNYFVLLHTKFLLKTPY
ncbi:SET and MYND domain-containing protein DDB_G0273591-like [Contarinia nasturtii]|uniref:SET and MYND domain-containing protein DDB_G0273591-like n=1 Tax=Contarinia nasturtii TaxID=265458 RepID=UPI0012D4A11B|nr:SET and MYND domain-containing protein DDB_G0273591-like [Contarinia nasturtii]